MRTICSLILMLIVSAVMAQFGPGIDISLSTANVDDVHAADLDGDGDMDIISASSGDEKIAWYANEGMNGFGTQRIIATQTANGGFSLDIDAVDMDGDGDIDVLAALSTDGKLAWYRNDGLGDFGPEEIISTGAYTSGSVHVADLDGDGDPDVVYGSYQFYQRVAWFANDGSGGFAPEHVISTQVGSINDVYTADPDGDGDQDVLAASGSGVMWYANDGLGGFGTEQVLPTQGQTNTVRAADLDGDGDEDVVTAYVMADTVAWYANDGLGGFGPPQVITTLADDPQRVHIADLDGDGDRDVLATSTSDYELAWYANDGAGGFGPQVIISGENGFVAPVLTADLDSDGDQDVLTGSSSWAVVYFSNNGLGEFGPEQVVSATAKGPSSVIGADLDGDNDQDVLVALESEDQCVWYANDGQGGFGPKQVITSLVDGPVAVQAADLDGDGDMDVLSASLLDHKVAWYANDGLGGFGVQQLITPEAAGAVSLHAVDMDADGDQDVLFAASDDYKIAWCANDGQGGFGTEQLITDQVGGLSDVFAADLDGDGQTEVLCAYSDRVSRFVYYGPDFWGEQIMSNNANGANSVHAADIDGDGDLDVLAALGYGNAIAVYRNSGAFGPQQYIAGDVMDVREVNTADLDNDGDLDVLSASVGDNKVAWYENDGLGAFGPQQVISTGTGGIRSVSTADLDNDGDLDVISASFVKVAWYRDHMLSNYRIEGTVFIDADMSGSLTAGDLPVATAPVSITPQLTAVITGDSGTYTAYVDPGLFQLESHLPETLWALTTSPAVRTVEMTTATPIITGVDFGWAPLLDTSIVLPSLTLGAAPCGDTAQSWLSYLNQGTRIEHGHITLELDTLFGFISSVPAPTSVTSNTITWEFDSLGYFEAGLIDLQLQLPQPGASGTSWANTTTLTTVDGLGDTTGVFELVQNANVACAYDPNDKQVEPRGYGMHRAVPADIEELTYTVRFQNTGTAAAYNVMIVDQLDEDLDWSSLQVLGTSHALSGVQVDEHGEAVFRFDDILLPDSNANEPESHGFIRYRIRTVDGAPDGTTITNCASIFFDLNEPVVTNTTLNTLVDCGLFNAAITFVGIDSLQATDGDTYQWFLDGDSIVGADQQGLMALVPGNYSVEVMNVYGCSDLSDPYSVLNIGYAETDGSMLRVVPNPARDQFTITSLETLPTDAVIDMMDVNGQVVCSMIGKGARRLVVSCGSMAAGIYVVRVGVPGRSLMTSRMVLE